MDRTGRRIRETIYTGLAVLLIIGVAWAADSKISALSSKTATSDDLLVIVDDPGGTPASGSITLGGAWDAAAALTNTGAINGSYVTAGMMANGDHGDFTYSSNVATLDADVVAPAEMADADHGEISWSGGVASIDANVVDGTNIALGSDAQGDVMYYNGTDWVRLAKGTAGQVLEMNAGATAPEWDTDDGGTPTMSVGVLETVSSPYTLNTAQVTGYFYYTTGAVTVNLPSAAGGENFCIHTYTAGASGSTRIDAPASNDIIYDGVRGSASGYIDSDGSSLGDFVCMVGLDTLEYVVVGRQGTWTPGP